MPIPRLKPYAGPSLLSYGFRPFFLLGAAYAGLSVLMWLPMFFGGISLPTTFSPLDWHMHEMLYGYVPAIVAGFLLTAIPNWTGRLPLQGAPVASLAVVWILGRIAIAMSALIGPLVAGVIDVAFLLLILAAIAREIIAGRNWRNIPPVFLVSVLLTGNIAFHIEDHWHGIAELSPRLGLAATIALVSLIGGRVVPSFTRNWLARENPGRLPMPFGPFDRVVLVFSGIALLSWVCVPSGWGTAFALLIAGVGHFVRLARWAGDRTMRDRLVLILHVGYAFVPLGFVLLAAAAFFPWMPPSAGIHAWTVGAIGTMTLAMMTRATLGHTGHALVAGPLTQAVYGVAIAAAILRVAAALLPEQSMILLQAAAIAWIAAFWMFAVGYGPALLRPRQSSDRPAPA